MALRSPGTDAQFLRNMHYIRILGKDRENLTKLNDLQSKISQILQSEYMMEIENRIQEDQSLLPFL